MSDVSLDDVQWQKRVFGVLKIDVYGNVNNRQNRRCDTNIASPLWFLFLVNQTSNMGKRIRLSNGRRLVDDVIRMANQMPIAGLSADLDVTEISRLRRKTRPKLTWNVILMKAYAQVCREHPELQRAYVGFPWGHLHEHDEPVCMMTIARQHQGEERLFFARFSRPDEFRLPLLQAQYDHFRKSPIEDIKQFRHQIKFAKAPDLIRRFAWWSLFNLWPSKRAIHMGTFGMSISGYNGAYGSMHLGPNTTTLGVDPLPRHGVSRTVLTFDHRVMDGTPATRILLSLQNKLSTTIRDELQTLIEADESAVAKNDGVAVKQSVAEKDHADRAA